MKTKTKRRICGWTAMLAFFLMLGFGGSVEHGTLPLLEGAAVMFSCLVIGAAAAYKGGYMR